MIVKSPVVTCRTIFGQLGMFAMTPSSTAWSTNQFLAALAPQDITRWLPHLRVLDLPAGHVLVKSHEKPQYVYFPTTSIVSLVHVEEDGSAVEVAVTGREGFVGVTQETISTMLGVRRETVSEAAGALQASGLIRYARGRIDLVDRQGLESRACECHAIVAQEYRRLLR